MSDTPLVARWRTVVPKIGTNDMHTQDLSAWTHDHEFDLGNPAAERGTRVVMWVTAVMMVVEIVGGWSLNSMALLADGLHMSSHTIAIGLSAFAYAAARRLSKDRRFAFGTWKSEVLAGFASAIFLLGIAALMVVGFRRTVHCSAADSLRRSHCHRLRRLGCQRGLRAYPRESSPSTRRG